MTITTRPPTFTWPVWRDRYRRQHRAAMDALRHGSAVGAALITEQAHENDDWLRDLPPAEQHHVMELLIAETEMLFELVHIEEVGQRFSSGQDSTEFRERLHTAFPLAFSARRAGLPRADDTVDVLRLVEAYAATVGWMP